MVLGAALVIWKRRLEVGKECFTIGMCLEARKGNEG
jgi:hypothetical protein